MNMVLRVAFIMLLARLAACHDFSSGNSSHAVSRSATVQPSPPSVRDGDCQESSFTKTSDVDAQPGGTWIGTLIDCATNTRHELVVALISEDGRFRIVGPNEHLLAGTGGTHGDLFTGSGLDFAETGSEYFSGPTTSLIVEGLILERQVFEGRWGTEWGSYGYFHFRYEQGRYERPTSLADLAGIWPMASSIGLPSPETAEGVWTIEPDGRFSGQDYRGCLYDGQFTVIDERFSMLAVEMAMSECSLQGSWSGLGYIEVLVDWYEKGIALSVDDGHRAVRFSLAIERP